MSGSDDDNSGQRSGDGTTPGEYVLGGLGGLLLAALLAFLSFQALAVRETGAELTVSVTSVEPAPGGHAVRFRVVNTGGRTAETVQVSGSLSRDGEQIEQSSATVAYVPPDSGREGTLVFSNDPADGRLTVAPSGYVRP